MTKNAFIIFITLLIASYLMFSCSDPKSQADLIIKTNHGDIYVKLYDETPKHKSNFLKLTDENYFNGQTFFRVIADAIAQGGGKGYYPENDPRNLIDAEITSQHFHKKGAFCAPRFPDDINPDRKSSGSQFYIVLGKIFTDEELNEIEANKTIDKRRNAINTYKIKHQKELFDEYQKSDAGKWLDSVNIIQVRETNKEQYEKLSVKINNGIDRLIIHTKIDSIPDFKFTNEQRQIYKEKGGLPELDGDYTVMGEVVFGLDVAETISRAVTELNSNTPAEKIGFKIERLK